MDHKFTIYIVAISRRIQQKIYSQILQIDAEIIPIFIEELNKIGQHYDSNQDLRLTSNSLPIPLIFGGRTMLAKHYQLNKNHQLVVYLAVIL